ncbi:hypothetical protein [Nitrosomonas sp.]|uniref:hypothetical protein n=1 Tax=Nitrosomonas sp. TaxID=42353 RepID=UPI0025D82F27|nr:hypothetical protein [Nitrosomonas sp.]MCC6917544.1 hypothetical protein [Nitrosomonas sp.]
MTNKKHQRLADRLRTALQRLDDGAILRCFDLTLWFGSRYASAYELQGPIYLVLDNSLIQAFKHRQTNTKRAVDALAFKIFCAFVRDWSDRESHLALSPMAIFEHTGRRPPASVVEIEHALAELQQLLGSTGLRIASLGFETPAHLFECLQAIVADEVFLTQFVDEIDTANWRIDLRAPMGVKIPMSEAWRALPEKLPLHYFDPWYVRFVLSARIEQHIIEQCQGHGPAPIGSGKLSETLADLNTFGRNGLLKGLGDIDLLQICDISRQYQHKLGYVLAGQTLDRDLAETLNQRHAYHVHAGVEGGDPQREERIKEMVGLMFSKPFAGEEARGRRIREQLAEFAGQLAQSCKQASASNAKTASTGEPQGH